MRVKRRLKPFSAACFRHSAMIDSEDALPLSNVMMLANVAAVIIGILSDTHDRADAMAAGLRMLQDAGAEYFIHCGDIGSQRCIDLLAGTKSAFVFGNCDFDRASLARYATSIDVPCFGNYADLTLDNRRIAVIHGDDFKLKQRLLS